ncbi:MAG: NAD(P)-dependent oxidoreductase [Pseudomonadales bacterium]|nr:NAD(P)-dependent oxidoreductase [Pseudomonadales bacterium]
MKTKRNVGYIGLGNIGKPSAERLVIDSLNAHVYDVYQPAVDELVSKGAIGCQSVAELAKACGHIGICVRDDQQVEALLYGEEGIFANAVKETVIAIHSTVTQANLLKWANEATELGIHLIDAPITGGAHRAADGTLCYMVGGSEEVVARSEPVFMTSAEKVVHAGALGSGIALKLCNNFIQYGEFVLLAEATKLADRCGLSVDVLREVGLSNGVVNEQMHMFVSGRNGLAANSTEEQMEQFFGAMGKLAQKDLDCALRTAGDHDVTLPTAEYLRDRIEDVFLARDESRLTE